MPGHSTWLTLLLHAFEDSLEEKSAVIGDSLIGGQPASWLSFEPIIASLLVCVFLLIIGQKLRWQMAELDSAVIPDDKLTLRTAMEAFLGYIYDLAKSVMDAERAKKYFPLIGASGLFVFVANVLALLPGMPVATSSLSITLGCALVVFLLFNVYGIMANGWGYITHLAGPAWYLWWLIFPIEVISLCVRPLTLAVRLALNMSVDHLILSVVASLFALLVPLPVMVLGCIVVLVQTLVFTMLTTIYIGLATEHEAH